MQKSREDMRKITVIIEHVQEDEPNTFALDIKEDMSVKDVEQKILEYLC